VERLTVRHNRSRPEVRRIGATRARSAIISGVGHNVEGAADDDRSGLDDLEPLSPRDASHPDAFRSNPSRAVRRRTPSPVTDGVVVLVALAAGAIGWIGGRATAPSSSAAAPHPTSQPEGSAVATTPTASSPIASTTSTIAAAAIKALGAALPIGYERLPVPSAARPGKPPADDFCTGSRTCSEEVFVLPAAARPATLVAWYDLQLGPTEIPWRAWQPCFPGNPAEPDPNSFDSERSWVQPGGRVLRLYLFAANADQPGPYVRITRGVEPICGDG